MLIKQISKILFPFTFTAYNINNTHFAKIVKYSIDLRKSVGDLMGKDNKNKIVKAYSLKKEFFSDYQVPIGWTSFKTRNKKQFEVLINDIELHFFENNFGLLSIDYSTNANDLEEINSFNYYFTECKSDKNYFIINETKFHLVSLVKNILKDITECNDFDNKPGLDYMQIKPILFSYILLDKKNNDDSIYHNLALNYKRSYKILDSLATISNPFENSTWCISNNAIINVSHLLESTSPTNLFFKETFADRFNKTYYFLVLAAINQRFSLIHVFDNFSYHFETVSTENELKNELKKANQIKQKLMILKHRNMFSMPTNIHHVNTFYDTLLKTFEIEKLLNCLEVDLQNLEDFTNIYLEKLNEYSKLKRERKDTFYAIGFVVVGSILAFGTSCEIYGLVIQTLNKDINPKINIIFLVLAAIIIIVIPFIFNVIKNIRKGLELTKKLKEMDED